MKEKETDSGTAITEKSRVSLHVVVLMIMLSIWLVKLSDRVAYNTAALERGLCKPPQKDDHGEP